MDSFSPSTLGNVFWFVLVGVLWGCTNPLMKQGSEGITQLPRKKNALAQFLSEFYFLFTRWQYVLPFLLNMSGSVVFFVSLANSELSLVAPITNALTFLFTTITSRILFPQERTLNASTLLGIGFVVTGVCICVLSKH